MDEHPNVDDAIDTAVHRTLEAERALEAEPPDSPHLVPKADVVEWRAEDLEELAHEAAGEARTRQT